MTTEKKATKRRSVSKARLYKELEAAIGAHGLDETATVHELMEAIKNDIVTEALK